MDSPSALLEYLALAPEAGAGDIPAALAAAGLDDSEVQSFAARWPVYAAEGAWETLDALETLTAALRTAGRVEAPWAGAVVGAIAVSLVAVLRSKVWRHRFAWAQEAFEAGDDPPENLVRAIDLALVARMALEGVARAWPGFRLRPALLGLDMELGALGRDATCLLPTGRVYELVGHSCPMPAPWWARQLELEIRLGPALDEFFASRRARG